MDRPSRGQSCILGHYFSNINPKIWPRTRLGSQSAREYSKTVQTKDQQQRITSKNKFREDAWIKSLQFYYQSQETERDSIKLTQTFEHFSSVLPTAGGWHSAYKGSLGQDHTEQHMVAEIPARTLPTFYFSAHSSGIKWWFESIRVQGKHAESQSNVSPVPS